MSFRILRAVTTLKNPWAATLQKTKLAQNGIYWDCFTWVGGVGSTGAAETGVGGDGFTEAAETGVGDVGFTGEAAA